MDKQIVKSINYRTWKIDICQIISSWGSTTYKFMIQNSRGENIDIPPQFMNNFKYPLNK